VPPSTCILHTISLAPRYSHHDNHQIYVNHHNFVIICTNQRLLCSRIYCKDIVKPPLMGNSRCQKTRSNGEGHHEFIQPRWSDHEPPLLDEPKRADPSMKNPQHSCNQNLDTNRTTIDEILFMFFYDDVNHRTTPR